MDTELDTVSKPVDEVLRVDLSFFLTNEDLDCSLAAPCAPRVKPSFSLRAASAGVDPSTAPAFAARRRGPWQQQLLILHHPGPKPQLLITEVTH